MVLDCVIVGFLKKTLNIYAKIKIKDLQLNMTESGFQILSTILGNVSVGVQVLVTTQFQNLKRLEPELHCKNNNFSFSALFENLKISFNLILQTFKWILKLVK